MAANVEIEMFTERRVIELADLVHMPSVANGRDDKRPIPLLTVLHLPVSLLVLDEPSPAIVRGHGVGVCTVSKHGAEEKK